MKIKYLGTGAYEGIPALFCDCDICRNAKKLGGKELRTRQQCLINDELLMDFGPDTLIHSHMYKIDWTKIHNILITHTHSDHFYVKDYEQLNNFYSHQENKRVNIYGGSSLIDILNNNFSHPKAKEEHRLIGVWKEVHQGEEFDFDGYHVMAIKANHPEKTTPYIYAIKKDNKSILYANDTAMLCDESFEYIKQFGHFDLVSIDCTGANLNERWVSHHMTLLDVLEFINILTKNGNIDETTIKVITHISHNSKTTHYELEQACEKHNIIAAYDGLEIKL